MGSARPDGPRHRCAWYLNGGSRLRANKVRYSRIMNQREFERVQSHIPVDVESGGKTVGGEARDIGFAGLWLPTHEPFAERTQCTVTIHLAETIKIRANGLVVRSEADGFAVQFLDLLDLDSYGHLRNLILYNSADPATVDEEIGRHFQLRNGSAPRLPCE
jgi:hypothetical protein